MRRVFLTLSGLVAATTLLISLKSAPGASRLPGQVAADNAAIAALASASANPSAGPPGSPGPTVPGPTVPGPTGGPSPTTAPPKAPTRTTKPPIGAPPPPGPAAPGAPVIVGDTAVTEFGFVRVAITVANGRMASVATKELPGDEPRSIALSDKYGPVLCQLAFTAQSANFDSITGATWTSDAFKQSLRSAMAKAGLA